MSTQLVCDGCGEAIDRKSGWYEVTVRRLTSTAPDVKSANVEGGTAMDIHDKCLELLHRRIRENCR